MHSVRGGDEHGDGAGVRESVVRASEGLGLFITVLGHIELANFFGRCATSRIQPDHGMLTATRWTSPSSDFKVPVLSWRGK